MNIFLKISLLTAFVGLLFSAQAQTKLDTNNGFMELTFDDTVDTWRKSISYVGFLSGGDTLYRYEGKCCRSGFGFEYPDILLTFGSKKELKTINLTTKPFKKNPDAPELTLLLTNLMAQFGYPEEQDEYSDGEIYWMGKEVMMSLNQDEDGEMDKCSINIRRIRQ